MSKHAGRKTVGGMARVMSRVAVSAVLLVGCGCGGSNNNPVSNERDRENSGLVLDNGKAWVTTGIYYDRSTGHEYTYTEGLIFHSNGDVTGITKYNNGWHYATSRVKWNIKGNAIVYVYPNGETDESVTYVLSDNGNTLTLMFSDDDDMETVTFTKNSNINLLQPTGRGNLVLGDGQAWVYTTGGAYYDEGLIFKSNGRFIDIERYPGADDWNMEREGTYKTSGSAITLTYDNWSEQETGTYGISYDRLVLRLSDKNGYTHTSIFDAVNDVYLSNDIYHSRKSPSAVERSQKDFFVNGYIFDVLRLSN